jgi:hypothetical protein
MIEPPLGYARLPIRATRTCASVIAPTTEAAPFGGRRITPPRGHCCADGSAYAGGAGAPSAVVVGGLVVLGAGCVVGVVVVVVGAVVVTVAVVGDVVVIGVVVVGAVSVVVSAAVVVGDGSARAAATPRAKSSAAAVPARRCRSINCTPCGMRVAFRLRPRRPRRGRLLRKR